jgi:hypothetical protein
LHETAAKKYAMLKGYEAKVLDVSGDNAGPHSKQTQEALKWFRQDNSVAAFYGFSGGGYDLLHILRALKTEELTRVKFIVVLGAPENPQSRYCPDNFKGGNWKLVYYKNPPEGHIFGPDWLLVHNPGPAQCPTLN